MKSCRLQPKHCHVTERGRVNNKHLPAALCWLMEKQSCVARKAEEGLPGIVLVGDADPSSPRRWVQRQTGKLKCHFNFLQALVTAGLASSPGYS
ncbi:hypothetical protein EYF80_032003 [Liparis tanakae]|uniref:Uncharacterized protein n=1 Tax=Liparis tanakae TaxID=230148 RepID=A0A4Z2GWJ0_9TELE|nr:hypothetical protein EYF80_032003 [Liparis tanakae]